MHAFLRSSVVVALSILGVGCSVAGSSGSPSGSPIPSTGGISHATGATDVLLRYDEGGGFVPIQFFANHVPIFTLYGDGTVIVRDPNTAPLSTDGGVTVNRPLRTARLTEEQIQATLRMAIDDGALDVARPEYGNDQVADASTATFTINAGGLKKTVSVYALGLDVRGGKDAGARAAFQDLAERLGAFGQDGTVTTAAYVPARYRGVLMDGSTEKVSKPWPWPELKPSDFVVPVDRNSYSLPSRSMTIAQAEALGFKSYEGGLQGLTLAGPRDGKVYSFTLRPLLPDEDRPSTTPPSAPVGPPDTPRPTTEATTQPTTAPSPIQSAQFRDVPITEVILSKGGRHLSIAFVGGKPFAEDDPCSIEYSATTRVVNGVLEVGVFDSRLPAVPTPVCDAMGYERHLEVDLASPFTGTSWRDRFDGTVHPF